MRSRQIIGWAAAGQLVFTLSQFLVLAALARYATQGDIGRFGLATAIITPIYWFSNLDLRINQSTDIASNYEFLDFLALRLVTSVAAYGLIVLIALVAVDDPLTRTILLVYAAARAAETVSDLAYGVLQKQHLVRLIAFSLSLRGALGTAVFSMILLNGQGVPAAFMGFAFAWILVAIALDLRVAWRASRAKLRAVSPGKVMDLFWEAIPLGFAGLLAGLSGSAPRFAIAATMSLEQLGQFTLISYILQVATVAISAISQAISSKLAHYTSNGQERAFRKLLTKFTIVLTLAGLAGVVLAFAIGGQLWRWIFSFHNQPSPLLLATVVTAATARANAIVLQTGLLAKRRFKDQAFIRLLVAVAMLAGSFVGVWLAGLVGVATAMTLVSTVHAYTLWQATVQRG